MWTLVSFFMLRGLSLSSKIKVNIESWKPKTAASQWENVWSTSLWSLHAHPAPVAFVPHVCIGCESVIPMEGCWLVQDGPRFLPYGSTWESKWMMKSNFCWVFNLCKLTVRVSTILNHLIVKLLQAVYLCLLHLFFVCSTIQSHWKAHSKCM